MNAKRVTSILFLVVLLMAAFVYFEARKVHRKYDDDLAIYSYFSRGYNIGWDENSDKQPFDPETAFSNWYDYYPGENLYSRMYPEYPAAFVSGYCYGYYDVGTDTYSHEDACYDWKDEHYNRFFNRLAIAFKIR